MIIMVWANVSRSTGADQIIRQPPSNGNQTRVHVDRTGGHGRIDDRTQASCGQIIKHPRRWYGVFSQITCRRCATRAIYLLDEHPFQMRRMS